MKTLPLKFKKWGDTFTQVKRTGDIALYERKTKQGKSQWEVFHVLRHDGLALSNGIKSQPAEFMVGTSLWGVKGWTFLTLEDAELKFDEQVSNIGIKRKRGRQPKAVVAKLPKVKSTKKHGRPRKTAKV